jgi:hypothetical protein
MSAQGMIPRQNRIMSYVIRACNELEVELLEVYCSALKCVYRFNRETESDAHWFLYGTSADYQSVLEAVRETVEQLEFDDMGHVVKKKPSAS